MHLFLLATAIVVPCWYAARRSLSRGMLEVNHVGTFTFGFLFYWITPLAARILAPRLDFPLAEQWAAYFRERFITPYALSCIGLYCCFMLGDTLAARRRPDLPARQSQRVPRTVLSMVALAGCVLMAYSMVAFRADIFRPPTDPRVDAARGAVTACLVLVVCVALIFTLDRPQQPWKNILRGWYFLALAASSLLMVFLGSRLYVASIVVMFAIYQTNFRGRIKLKKALAVLLLLTFFFGAVGRWREGSSTSGAFVNVLAEPMIGSVSLVHHLRYKGIAWVNRPDQLISDFANLIPTVLMPDKYKLLKKPDAYRPLGGLHSFVSFNLNFGLLGTAVFWFLWPVLFRFCRRRFSSTLFATIYVMSSGWLAFTFFRDPFSISLVKAIFENSIVIPCVIVLLGRFFTAACSPVRESGALMLRPKPEGA